MSDLKSDGNSRAGSSPVVGTRVQQRTMEGVYDEVCAELGYLGGTTGIGYNSIRLRCYQGVEVHPQGGVESNAEHAQTQEGDT